MDRFFTYAFVGFLIGTLIAGFVMHLVGYSDASTEWQRAAIDHGAAQMVLVDEYGNTEFKWNDEIEGVE